MMTEMKTSQLAVADSHYKDTVFRAIFKEKRELLSLYNAINGTCYEDEEALQISTLENAVYMNMRNDVSCILDMRMNLYEHQSTINPNMPLRDLFYVSKQLEAMTAEENLYSSKKIVIPTPRFVTFYNGKEWQPEVKVMRLSELFGRRDDEEEPALELVVVQLNINPGFNDELKSACKALGEYMLYVMKVRHYREEYLLDEAVERAISECIKEGILKEFLIKQRAEAKAMSIFEYDQEKHMQMEREEHYQLGFEDGIVCGMDQGIEQGITSSLLFLLEELGSLPDELVEKINETKDKELLYRWIKRAREAKTLEEFVEKM